MAEDCQADVTDRGCHQDRVSARAQRKHGHVVDRAMRDRVARPVDLRDHRGDVYRRTRNRRHLHQRSRGHAVEHLTHDELGAV